MKTNQYDDPRPVKCNWCEWKGDENDLELEDLSEHETIEKCPKCGRDDCLMDL